MSGWWRQPGRLGQSCDSDIVTRKLVAERGGGGGRLLEHKWATYGWQAHLCFTLVPLADPSRYPSISESLSESIRVAIRVYSSRYPTLSEPLALADARDKEPRAPWIDRAAVRVALSESLADPRVGPHTDANA